MLSTAQRDFLQDFLTQHYKEGYQYYVAHTNTNLSNYTSYNFRDLSVIVSKTPITSSSSYRFSSANPCIRYDVITRNASNNRDDDRIERIEQTNLSSLDLSVNDYEWIETNAVNSLHQNILAPVELQYRDNLAMNIDVNDYFIIPICLSIIIVSKWLKDWFGKTRGERLEA